MILFKQLLNRDYYYTFIEERLKKSTPNAYRFGKRYKIAFKEQNIFFPDSIPHLIGYVQNTIKSLCKDYKHGQHQSIWIKKEPFTDGPRVTKKRPEQEEDYRHIVVLNRVDHLLHLLVAHCIKDILIRNNELILVKSRKDNIQATSEFIKAAFSKGFNYYYSADIRKFGESFDIDIAKEALIQILEKHTDTDDIVLINNLLSSYREIPKHKYSGSPMKQLLAELILAQVEKEVSVKIHPLFTRYGEDFAFCMMSKDEYAEIERVLASIIKKIAGNECELHSAKQVTAVYDERYQVKNIFNSDIETKGSIGSFGDDSMDFCGYNYSMENNNIIVRIRHKTMRKIKEKIREYTDGADFRSYDLPEKMLTDKGIKTIILRLNGLFGYYHRDNKYQFSRLYGLSELFKMPAEIDSKGVMNQAERLNHYMLRRLRHLHMRDMMNHSRVNAGHYREEVDKSYRRLGLRTLLDAISHQ